MEKQQQGKPSQYFKTARFEGFGGDEGSRMDGEDETQDCTFPPSFELFPWGFLNYFFPPERSALLSELEVTSTVPDMSVIVFDESLV